jgi:hypothetical protein
MARGLAGHFIRLNLKIILYNGRIDLSGTILKGLFALRSRRVRERCLGVLWSGSKSAGYGVWITTGGSSIWGVDELPQALETAEYWQEVSSNGLRVRVHQGSLLRRLSDRPNQTNQCPPPTHTGPSVTMLRGLLRWGQSCY